MNRNITCLLLACITIAALPGSAWGAPDQGLKRSQYTQIHMGVQVRIVVFAPDRETAATACRAAFARIAELDEIMSDYRPRSELMRLCAQAGGRPVPVSDDLFLVLQRAQDLARRSRGAFDVTSGPYVRLWRRARDTGQLPSAEELEEAWKRVGWQRMRLDPDAQTVRLLVPGMQLDLGGIAKGYALDCALDVLRQHGISRALLEAGGDIRVGDAPAGEPAWRIMVAGAAPGKRFVTLTNAAISTSGDTEQYVDLAGERYSHIVDPRTGLRRGKPVLATVTAPDAITSDSLATAACVLGPRAAARLVRSVPGAEVYVRQPPVVPTAAGTIH